MTQILDIAGKPMPPRRALKRSRKEQDLRDLGKIATVFAVIAIGYFQFAPEQRENTAGVAAIARK